MPSLPITIDGAGRDLEEYLSSNRKALRNDLCSHGALLFRGFTVGEVGGFDAAVRALSEAPLPYSERSSPRRSIKGDIYTSTEYPPEEEIFLHNENSYQVSWPRFVFFFCMEPPTTRGATPLADTREVYRLVDPDVRREFEGRGWKLVRNHRADIGLPWQEVFGTERMDEVERYCLDSGLEAEWVDGGGLRTSAIRPATQRHPETGAQVWFNHLTVFNVGTLPREIQAALLELCGPDGLPSNTFYGDGAPIPEDVLQHLRSCYRAAATRFDYRRDDVLVIDNMLTAHGREPFTGPRRIAVAMTEAFDSRDRTQQSTEG